MVLGHWGWFGLGRCVSICGSCIHISATFGLTKGLLAPFNLNDTVSTSKYWSRGSARQKRGAPVVIYQGSLMIDITLAGTGVLYARLFP